MSAQPKHIFVFKVGSLGDSIVALPAIDDIYRHYRQKLHFITNKPAHGVFPAWQLYQHTPFFSDAFEFDFSLSGILQLKKYIARQKGEKVLFYFADESPLKRNVRNYLFFKFIGIDKVYGWKECSGTYIKRDNTGKLLPVEPEYIRLRKIVEKYTAQKIQPDISHNYLVFPKDFSDTTHLKFPFVAKSSFLAVGLGGKNKIQQWDVERYASVINRINTSTIVILGGKTEDAQARRLQQLVPDKTVLNLCGQTTILESAYLLKHACAYLGNDTGTAHLAALVGCRCLVISSARDNPGRWTPVGNQHIVIRSSPPCAGCWLHVDTCPYNVQCLTSIDAQEVVEAFKSAEMCV